MRVLFLESSKIWTHTLPLGFSNAGHQVMISGPLTEHNIPQMISQFRPQLIVSIGWGLEQTIQKQLWIHKYVHEANIPLIYWAVEDSAYTEVWSLPLIGRVKPHFVFSICPDTVKYYKRLGIRAAHLDFGYHPSIHHRTAPRQRYQASIAVVANAYPHILEQYPDHHRRSSLDLLIRPLLERNFRIDFYGKDWELMKPFLGTDIPSEWIHGHLPYTEAHKVYSSADIMLGLQNYLTNVTQRTYEILGSEGFLLTEDTPAVRRLGQPGRDLVVSSSPEETIRLVEYYLQHPAEREQIRRNGKQAIKSETYFHRAKRIVSTLIEEGILERDAAAASEQGELFHYSDGDHRTYEMYVVKKGDTLSKIALQYGVPVEEIKMLNGLSSDLIYVDQPLKVKEQPSGSPTTSIEPLPQGPSEVISMLNRAAWLFHLDAKMLRGVAYAESRLGLNAGVNEAGAYGIMQLMQETAEEMGIDRMNPWQNILGGAMYLKDRLAEFDGDIPKALAAYNCGADKVMQAVLDYGESWLSALPLETQQYIATILKFMKLQP